VYPLSHSIYKEASYYTGLGSQKALGFWLPKLELILVGVFQYQSYDTDHRYVIHYRTTPLLILKCPPSFSVRTLHLIPALAQVLGPKKAPI
jgi:hypothetical protein